MLYEVITHLYERNGYSFLKSVYCLSGLGVITSYSIHYTKLYELQAGEFVGVLRPKQQTFQITFPSSGFGGMVLKPWDERKRTVFQLLPEVQQKLHDIPGIRVLPVTPPALPGGGQFPVEFILASTRNNFV